MTPTSVDWGYNSRHVISPLIRYQEEHFGLLSAQRLLKKDSDNLFGCSLIPQEVKKECSEDALYQPFFGRSNGVHWPKSHQNLCREDPCLWVSFSQFPETQKSQSRENLKSLSLLYSLCPSFLSAPGPSWLTRGKSLVAEIGAGE